MHYVSLSLLSVPREILLFIGPAKKYCFANYLSCYVKQHVDCKTVRIFAYSSTREQSKKRSGKIVRSLSAKYRPGRYRRDKSVKFGTQLPQHLPINTGGGARYKWSYLQIKAGVNFHLY